MDAPEWVFSFGIVFSCVVLARAVSADTAQHRPVWGNLMSIPYLLRIVSLFAREPLTAELSGSKPL
ncbi:hypothetical protein GCM10022270_01670 [Terriglobus aquaticus]